MGNIERDTEPLRLRWNSLAGWHISGIGGVPGWDEQSGPVEYVRADTHQGAVGLLATIGQFANTYDALDERATVLVPLRLLRAARAWTRR